MFHFTLKQLRYFSAVADHGGIAQAARILNISQPAVAFALDKLEDMLGARLLARQHARGAELTPEGREVLGIARQLLRAASETETAFQAIVAELRGHLRLGCFQTLAPFYIPGFVKVLGNRHPGITLDVSESRHDELVAALTGHEIDLAFLYAMGLDRPSLSRETLKAVEPYVLLARDHPLAAQRSISLKALASDPYILFDWPGTREYFLGLLETAGISPPIAFRSHSYELVRGAVANGLGFSLLSTRPRSDRAYDGKHLVCRPIKEQLPALDIVAAWPRGATASPLRNAILELAHDYFAQA